MQDFKYAWVVFFNVYEDPTRLEDELLFTNEQDAITELKRRTKTDAPEHSWEGHWDFVRLRVPTAAAARRDRPLG